MDERCSKFAADAAQRPTDAKLIATLRKFLFRNQEQRLSAASQQALCDACVRHAAAAGADATSSTGLLEDALAMPFNIFTTGHKKQLLKHLDRLRGLEGGGGGAPSAANANANADDGSRECAVMDVRETDGAIEVMDDEGETAVVTEVGEEDAVAIREAFAKGEEVRVRAVFGKAAKAKEKGGGGNGDEAGATARVVAVMIVGG
jgi:hypothetical protein